MFELISKLLTHIDIDKYAIIITILFLISIIFSMYYNIRFLCLKKADEKVAEIEKNHELTGKEKFAIVVKWIDDELPAIFRNTFTKLLIERLVNYAYNSSSEYMKNYIKRKTGYDISELIKELPPNKETDSTES